MRWFYGRQMWNQWVEAGGYGVPADADLTAAGFAAHDVVTSKEGHDAELGEVQAIQAFGDTTEPGQADFWITPGAYGLPADAEITRGGLRGYAYTLFIRGVDGRVYGLPWRNVVAGEDNPVTVYGP